MKSKSSKGKMPLDQHGKKHQNDPDAQRIATALDIYSQVGSILENFRNNYQTISHQSKRNSIWFIDEHGVVHLSDKVEKSNGIAKSDSGNAKLLGENLYQYLTNCEDSDLNWPYDFERPIFKSKEGERLQGIIRYLTHPTERQLVQDGLQQLDQIQMELLKKECRVLLEEIRRVGRPEDSGFVTIQNNALLEEAVEKLKILKNNLLKRQEKIVTAYQTILTQAKKEDGLEDVQFTFYKEKLDARPSMEEFIEIKKDAQKSMFFLDKVFCKNLLSDIKRCGFGEKDEKMNQYVKAQEKKIEDATSSDVIEAINNDLRKMYSILSNQPAAEIKNIIQSFRTQASWLTVGMNAKAQRIEDAMTRVPLEERGYSNIVNGNTKAMKGVIEALASHRHLHQKTIYKTKDNAIDEEKAASSFKQFKQQFSVVVNDKDNDPNEENDATSTFVSPCS